jgi:hypothetical protein
MGLVLVAAYMGTDNGLLDRDAAQALSNPDDECCLVMFSLQTANN